ncbi:unnamed protein product [Ilex paraguariensis]|uniref:Mitochondrial import inner membrane translocase subunit n=1 Tax=Ilex paraguariensis TaxID=185542 RepID=A0ABC8TMR2_9AQUA
MEILWWKQQFPIRKVELSNGNGSRCWHQELDAMLDFAYYAESKVLLHSGSGTVRGKCFDKCITKPGSSLSGSESSCISRCVDRYIEATGIISKALFSAPR